MKTNKVFLVSLFLFLPVLLFFFFIFFGKNEFQVPVYYLEKTDNTPVACKMDYHFPYRIPHASRLNLQGTAVVFFMDGLNKEQYDEALFQLSRISLKFNKHNSSITWISVHQVGNQLLPTGNTVLLDSMAYQLEKRCYYLSSAYPVVLIDADRRIRGYYNSSPIEEMDRLAMELSILLDGNKKNDA